MTRRFRRTRACLAGLTVLAGLSITLASCAAGGPATGTSSGAPAAATASASRPRATQFVPSRRPAISLPAPAAVTPFGGTAPAGPGRWHPAGRQVRGLTAVYETTLVPPGGTQVAGLAWMDTRLLAARLYSGSMSPGGGPYRFTAPVRPAQGATLVAAFNGGFKMRDARGGYYTEGHTVVPLVLGAASLVIYADGSVRLGAWGPDVTMTRDVASVRQNLVPLVAGGRPTPLASTRNWHFWGSTCSATSCGHGLPGVEHQWRSGLGITADGALVYTAGPALAPLQLAQLLIRAGAVRAMELDINPAWPVFASYAPASSTGLAAPSNGRKLLASFDHGPDTFFTPSWPRDFITMSARPAGSAAG
ncbi:MAG TPA: hypothetical protein VH089_21545 [Streptosporangiaceae bacterium]|nr:hypothetical protein [Streptosporangiaceae bacterium]